MTPAGRSRPWKPGLTGASRHASLQTSSRQGPRQRSVRIALKKRPIDRNTRTAMGLSRSEEQPLLTGINTLYSEEGGDILSLKNVCFQDY
ncbi:hypothetical protein ZWY2020_034077 [Hordeum vulgare]|nr:hypothetical protein ZWY2020_034077 [Hordeum vulgare]